MSETVGSLVVIKKNGSEGSHFPIDKDNAYNIGSNADCHIRFNIDKYSENVCTFIVSKKGLVTVTKNSTCPVIINNTELKNTQTLDFGDVIQIGAKTFKWNRRTKPRESFTRNVFKSKTPSQSPKKNAQKGKRRSSVSDFRSKRSVLSTWRETEENLKSSLRGNLDNVAVSNSPVAVTNSEIEPSSKSKTVPKNHGSQPRTPRSDVSKTLKFKSADKRASPKKKYFETSKDKPSKIPRKFFPDPKPSIGGSKTAKPQLKKNTEEKENVKTPKIEQRKSTRQSSKDLSLNITPVALTEANVRTPDSLGFKPVTPNIKLVKSVTKKNASLKKSLDNKTLAKKRKISSVSDEEYFENKKFKLADSSLIQNETMGSLFESSVSVLDSPTMESSRRSNRTNNTLSPLPVPPKQFYDSANVSGIKSLTRTPGKSAAQSSPAVRSVGRSRQKKTENRRFTESNLISFKTPNEKSKPVFSTPKVQSAILDFSVDEKIKSPKSAKNSTKRSVNVPSPRKGMNIFDSPLKTNISSFDNSFDTTISSSKSSRTSSPSKSFNLTLSLSSSRKSSSPLKSLTNKSLNISGCPFKSPSNKILNTSAIQLSSPKKSLSPIKTPKNSPVKTPKNLSPNKSLRINSSTKKLLTTTGSPPKFLSESAKQLLSFHNSPAFSDISSPSNSPLKTPKNYSLSKSLTLGIATPAKKLNISISAKTPKSAKKTPLTGVKKLLKTPDKSSTTPKIKISSARKSLANPVGRPSKSEKLLKTPGRASKTPNPVGRSPKTPVTKLFSTPGSAAKISNTVGRPSKTPVTVSAKKSPRSSKKTPRSVGRPPKTPRPVGRPPKTPSSDSPQTILKTPNPVGRPRKSSVTASAKKLLKTPGKTPKSAKKLTPGSAKKSPVTVSAKKLFRTHGSTQTPRVVSSKILKTPATPASVSKSPKIGSVTKLLKSLVRSPMSPSRDVKSGRVAKSPKNDLTDVVGVKKRSRPPKSPKNDLTNVTGVKKLLRTPGRSPKSPKNDLTNVFGVKKLLKTPGRPPKSPKNDLTNIAGVKKLLKTPGRPPKSPKNDLTNIAGVKKLLGSPKIGKSPNNDLSDLRGVKQLLGSARRAQNSPKNDLSNITGVKKLLGSPRLPAKSPKNDLTNVRGVRDLLHPQRSPRNNLMDVSIIKSLFASPEIKNSPKTPARKLKTLRKVKSPKNDLTDVRGVKKLLTTPKAKNDLSNISGIDTLFNTSTSSSKNMDVIFDCLKNEINDSLDLTVMVNSKSPMRTYERRGKSLSPAKPEKITQNRKSLRAVQEDSRTKENVQTWLTKYVLSDKTPKNKHLQIEPEIRSSPRSKRSKKETSTPESTRKTRQQLEEIVEPSPKRPKQVQEPKHVQFNVSIEEIQEKPKSRRGIKKTEPKSPPKSRKRKIQDSAVTNSPVRSTRRKKTEEDTPKEEPSNEEKKTTTRGRRGKKEETIEEVNTTKRGKKKEPIVKEVKTTNKRGKKEEPIVEEVKTTTKRGKKEEIIEEVKTTKRGKKEEPITEEVKTTTRRGRGKKIEETPVVDEEKKPTRGRRTKIEKTELAAAAPTRGRRAKKVEETEEQQPKPTRTNKRAKKTEEKIEEPVEEKPTRNKRAAKIVEDTPVKEEKPKRGARAKKIEEVPDVKPTRGGRQKKVELAEEKPTENKKKETRTRSTRVKKTEEPEEPVQRSTRARRNK